MSNLQKLRDAGVAVTEIDDPKLRSVGDGIVESYAAENELIRAFLDENR